ncbi:MAG TPA: trehalase family glycosidase [Candidatus Saccharimonadales bacterium]|nr:trehalase family glycosidase [Candidatus Saccharimonadales bacterium]
MVINRAKKIKSRLQNIGAGPSYKNLSLNDAQPALDYIQSYWHKLERYHPKDEGNLIGLPKPFLVPSFEEGHEFDYNELYYWDSYFMVQGLLDDKHKDLVLGILDDLIYLFERFNIIPNASRLYLTSRSQPPFLTSFIWDIHNAYVMDKKWLGEKLAVAEREYETVWMGTQKPNARQVYKGLSRYYDFNYLNDIAETESGWDMTPRFGRKALDYLPADLNALLYKYEMDFARYYELIGNHSTMHKWKQKAHVRKKNMDQLMWNGIKSQYYDYNYVKKRRGTVNSLASYYPMWAKMANKEQARKLVRALKRYEHEGGLSTTDTIQLTKFVPGVTMTPTQWAYPNGWAPLHFLIIKGLENYGYHDDARRIALKWLKTNLDWFNTHGVFLEKYNVITPKNPPEKGLYPSQTGFGWTNSVFTYLANKYLE